MKTNFRLIYLLCISTAITACNGGAVSETTTSKITAPAVTPKLSQDHQVFIDDLGLIPLVGNTNATYRLNINNVSNQNYTIDSVFVSEEDSKLLSVSNSECGVLNAGSSCAIVIAPKARSSANVILMVTLRDNNGKAKTISQLIRMSDKVAGRRISFQYDLNTVFTPDGNYSISIPIILNQDYSNVKAANGDLKCSQKGFAKGNSCTLNMKGKVVDNTLVAARLIAYQNDKPVETEEDSILVRVAQARAHLVAPSAFYAVGGETKIRVYNNGSGAATDVSVENNSNKVELVSNSCHGSIPAGEACEIEVARKGQADALRAEINVKYKADKNDPQISIAKTIVMFATDDIPVKLVNSSSMGDLSNSVYGTVSKQLLYFRLESSSIVTVQDIKVEGLNMPEGMKIVGAEERDSCQQAHDPSSLSQCFVQIEYAPKDDKTIDEGSITLVISGKYTLPQGGTQPVKPIKLWEGNIKYSALASNAFNILSLTKEDGESSPLTAYVGKNASFANYQVKNIGPSYLLAKYESASLSEQSTEGLQIDDSNCKNVGLIHSEDILASGCTIRVGYKPNQAEERKATLNVNYKVSRNGSELSSMTYVAPELKLRGILADIGLGSEKVQYMYTAQRFSGRLHLVKVTPGVNPKLEVVKTIVNTEVAYGPAGIAIDNVNHRMYIGNYERGGFISKCDLNTDATFDEKKCSTFNTPQLMGERFPKGLTLDGNKLHVVGYNGLSTCDLDDSGNIISCVQGSYKDGASRSSIAFQKMTLHNDIAYLPTALASNTSVYASNSLMDMQAKWNSIMLPSSGIGEQRSIAFHHDKAYIAGSKGVKAFTVNGDGTLNDVLKNSQIYSGNSVDVLLSDDGRELYSGTRNGKVTNCSLDVGGNRSAPCKELILTNGDGSEVPVTELWGMAWVDVVNNELSL